MPASPRLQALLRAKEENEIGNFLSAVLEAQDEIGGIEAERYMEIMDRSPYSTGVPVRVGYEDDDQISPLDVAAIVSSSIPIVGDITGLAADADMYARDPESRNMINYLLSAAGAIPLIPAASQVRKTIKAYHGSPHDFDEFSTEAIGTGEGAQAYGHGLYFAESEKVAKEYRDQLTKRDIDYEEWLMGKYKEAERNQDYSRMEMYERAIMHDTPADFRDTASDLDYDEDYRGLAEEIAEEIEEYGPNLGRMYEVDIDVSPEELLDFDAPINQQPKIMQAFRDETYDMEADAPGEMLGMDLLRMLGDGDVGSIGQYSSPKAASLLQEAGIKGIRYADAFTRHKSPDKQSKNYVIFDERLISIAKKYGIAIPVAAAMLAKETGQDPQELYQEDPSV